MDHRTSRKKEFFLKNIISLGTLVGTSNWILGGDFNLIKTWKKKGEESDTLRRKMNSSKTLLKPFISSISTFMKVLHMVKSKIELSPNFL
jgi:hypothetical protein